MLAFALPYTLHVLAALVWVGGMFFAWLVLRPATVAALEGPARLRCGWKFSDVSSAGSGWRWRSWRSVVSACCTCASAASRPRRYVQVMIGGGIAMFALFMRIQALLLPELKAAVLAGTGRRGGGAGADSADGGDQPAAGPGRGRCGQFAPDDLTGFHAVPAAAAHHDTRPLLQGTARFRGAAESAHPRPPPGLAGPAARPAIGPGIGAVHQATFARPAFTRLACRPGLPGAPPSRRTTMALREPCGSAQANAPTGAPSCPLPPLSPLAPRLAWPQVQPPAWPLAPSRPTRPAHRRRHGHRSPPARHPAQPVSGPGCGPAGCRW
jgi:uncharacterized membrane protein